MASLLVHSLMKRTKFRWVYLRTWTMLNIQPHYHGTMHSSRRPGCLWTSFILTVVLTGFVYFFSTILLTIITHTMDSLISKPILLHNSKIELVFVIIQLPQCSLIISSVYIPIRSNINIFND